MIDIIIPVYNTPIKDLKRCLDSIIHQKYDNYKVIIIDDGSINEISIFLDEYVSNKPKFTVKHISNSGVSTARNIGLEISNSEYITFVDSDDTIEKNFLKDSYKIIEENNLDLIIGGYNEITNDKIEKIRKSKDGFYIYDKNNKDLFLDKLISTKNKFENQEIASAPIGRIYSRIYRRSAIGNLRFNKDIKISEDTLFMVDLTYSINKIGLTSDIWYNYYQNDYSAVHCKDEKIMTHENLKCIREFYKRMQKEENPIIKNSYKLRIFKKIYGNYNILELYNIFSKEDRLFIDIIKEEVLKTIDFKGYTNLTKKETDILNNITNS